MEDPGDCYHLLVERCPIRIFHRAIGNLVIPASFLIAVSVIVLNLRLLPTAPDTLWLIGPSVALAISGTLALAYNRSRAFFTCIACAFCLWLWGQEMAPDFKELIIIGFVPLNLLLICFFRERGI